MSQDGWCRSAYDKSPGNISASYSVLEMCWRVVLVHSVCPRSPTIEKFMGKVEGGVLKVNCGEEEEVEPQR